MKTGEFSTIMRNILIGCAAAALLATPAAARDKAGYFGAEGGALWAKDLTHDLTITNTSEGTSVQRIDNAVNMNFKKPGLDLDLIAGYDFGIVRLEGELGYKRASLDSIDFAGEGSTDARGNVGVTSAMANLLLDFGKDDGVSFYAGPGIGWSRVKMNNIEPDGAGFQIEGKDNALALQGIAGIRYAITPQLDIGLKYRYFRTQRLDLDPGTAAFSTNLVAAIPNVQAPGGPAPSGTTNVAFTRTATLGGNYNSRFSSHSLLASLIFNFRSEEHTSELQSH